MSGIGFLSLDILIILILFIFLFLLSFKTGKKLLVTLIVSFYPTVLIFKNLPYDKINITDQVLQAILFLILYGLSTYILWKNIHVKKYHETTRKFIDYFLLTTTYLILFISININSVPALSSIYQFTGSIINFVSYIPYSAALIIPIIIILITNRRHL
jgi:hypothetical protein